MCAVVRSAAPPAAWSSLAQMQRRNKCNVETVLSTRHVQSCRLSDFSSDSDTVLTSVLAESEVFILLLSGYYQ